MLLSHRQDIVTVIENCATLFLSLKKSNMNIDPIIKKTSNTFSDQVVNHVHHHYLLENRNYKPFCVVKYSTLNRWLFNTADNIVGADRNYLSVFWE